MRGFARSVRGIEWIAAAELAGRTGATVDALGHREIHFTVPHPVPELLDVRTVDDVFVTAFTVDGLDHTRASLGALAEATREAAGAVVAAVSEVGRLRAVRATWTFDAVGTFLGRRNYNRTDIEDAFGGAVEDALGNQATYFSRRDDRVPPLTDVSWRVHLRDSVALVGVRLGPHPLHRRAYKVAAPRGTLHPPVAAALALVAGVGGDAAGDPGLLLDPFCGAGTIVVEHALAGGARSLGIDVSAAAATGAITNARAAGVDGSVGVVRADASRAPLARGCVTRVVTNPPWNRTVAMHAAGDEAAAWAEVARVSAPSARAVVLTEAGVPAPPGWEGPLASFPISLSGLHPRVSVFTAPGADPSALPPEGNAFATELRAFAALADT
ncbi:MAG TPA: hypothetical protein VF230_01485 [Acidimicrobiales bacterium]